MKLITKEEQTTAADIQLIVITELQHFKISMINVLKKTKARCGSTLL
jgi:hypothetical protein